MHDYTVYSNKLLQGTVKQWLRHQTDKSYQSLHHYVSRVCKLFTHVCLACLILRPYSITKATHLVKVMSTQEGGSWSLKNSSSPPILGYHAKSGNSTSDSVCPDEWTSRQMEASATVINFVTLVAIVTMCQCLHYAPGTDHLPFYFWLRTNKIIVGNNNGRSKL